MDRSATLIGRVVAICAGYLIIGGCYVAALWLKAGTILTIAMVLAPAAALIWYSLRRLATGPDGIPDRRLQLTAILVSAGACVVIKEHGAYDAWLHWNSLAKYMSEAGYFGALQRPASLWHADYPPGLPAPIGFIWRMSGHDTEWVPRIISFLFYLCIPILLCNEALQLRRYRHFWLSIPALFVLNYECLSQGLNQYADVPLALFFLLSLMCLDQMRRTQDRIWAIAAGAMLGGCLLMKNEGAVIAAAVLLSHARQLYRGRAFLRIAAGLLFPLMVLILYKSCIPTPNDVFSSFGGSDILRRITDPERYRIIGYYLLRFSVGRFPLFILFFAWALWKLRGVAVWRKSGAICMALCAGGYVAVYLTTNIWLSWLVPTSLNRLMMQLLPAGVYLVIRSLQESRPTEELAAKPDKAGQYQ